MPKQNKPIIAASVTLSCDKCGNTWVRKFPAGAAIDPILAGNKAMECPVCTAEYSYTVIEYMEVGT